jgi:hypothetical protein
MPVEVVQGWSRIRDDGLYFQEGNEMKRLIFGIAALGLALAFVVLVSGRDAVADHVAYSTGDIFAGVGAGQIKHFDSSGNLLETLDTTSGSSFDTGMCFDSSGNLYATNWTAGNMSKFDKQGGLLTHPWGGPFSARPESCVFDAAGNIYVGETSGENLIRKFDQGGNLLATYSPATERMGIDWIDLAADQCTMFYTSEGSSVKRYDVCADSQLADFATGLAGRCFALRIRANGEVIVTCASQSYLLNPDGSVNMTYPIADGFLFAMNLDPDGDHFWTGGLGSGNVYKVNFATGAGTGAPVFNVGILGSGLAGLAIFGEPVVAIPTATPVTPEDTPTPTDTPVTPTDTPTPTNTPVMPTDTPTLPGELEIDIKPGSDPNSIKLRNKGVIPVAILGSAALDVTTVDVTTLAFGPSGASPRHDLPDAEVHANHLEDVNGDGFLDLVSHYRTRETGIAVGDTEACLTGVNSGTPFIACDAVRTL